MRSGKKGGRCDDCGRQGDGGLYWHDNMVVLDLGVPGMIWEPEHTGIERCDGCELAERVRRGDDRWR